MFRVNLEVSHLIALMIGMIIVLAWGGEISGKIIEWIDMLISGISKGLAQLG